MHKLISISLFMFIVLRSTAQDKMEADRPGETRTPELVKGDHFQVEAGFRKEKLSPGIHLYQHPTVSLRYGLFNAIELRAEVVSQTVRNSRTKEKINGLRPVEFGIKAKILPEYKGFPSVGILGHIGVPKFSTNDYYNARLPLEFRTLFNNTLSKNVKVQYNAGVKWEGDNREAQWMYSFTPAWKVSEKITLFIEEYAFLGKSSSAEHYLDGGFDIYLDKNWMFDFSAGVGLSEQSSPYFIAAGTSFRLSVR